MTHCQLLAPLARSSGTGVGGGKGEAGREQGKWGRGGGGGGLENGSVALETTLIIR